MGVSERERERERERKNHSVRRPLGGVPREPAQPSSWGSERE